ncbi:MAG: phosphoribosylanthranilate isomerase [Alphaproteobacteria bacterium]|nr:phosphoribosylanthranilate isomerase [Alphaproteobacteria bacterium]
MTLPIVKICGLNDAGSIAAAGRAGASHVGFNFFPPSPRYVTPAQARTLCANVAPHLTRVVVLVDPTDEAIDEAVAACGAHAIQLHGSETPERVAEIRERTGLILIKALPVTTETDLEVAWDYEAADMILFDAKPPADATRPGGLGKSFDWSVAAGFELDRPWILSGGLTPDNVQDAIRVSGAMHVDVSSGVEAAPGVKSPRRIVAFCEAALAVLDTPEAAE